MPGWQKKFYEMEEDMPIISVVEDDPLRAIIWASVYAVNDLRPDYAGDFTFEILERDGNVLEQDTGKKQLMSADGGQVFWGELVSLTPCMSTVPGLGYMRDKPALRGVLRVYPDVPSRNQ